MQAELGTFRIYAAIVFDEVDTPRAKQPAGHQLLLESTLQHPLRLRIQAGANEVPAILCFVAHGCGSARTSLVAFSAKAKARRGAEPALRPRSV